MKLTLAQIRAKIPDRPDGYYEDVLSQGTVSGDELELTQEAFAALCLKYSAMPVPQISLKEKLSNFAKAVEKWRRYGFPIVTESQLRERAAQCEACDYWQREKLIPDCGICGCGRLKHELATEQCPLPEPLKKWRAIS